MESITITELRKPQNFGLYCAAVIAGKTFDIVNSGASWAYFVPEVDAGELIAGRDVSPVSVTEVQRTSYSVFRRVLGGEVLRVENLRGQYVVGYLIPPIKTAKGGA